MEKCVECGELTERKGEPCDDCADDAKLLANLKKMIVTANKAADQKNYQHGEIELAVIARVMDAKSIVSVPPGVERVVGAYYKRMTGRKPYYL